MGKKALVVDDEPLVRTFVSRIFQSLDFQTLESDNPKHAAQLYSEQDREINLIFSELDLVRGNGLELYKKIRQSSTRVAFILCCDALSFPMEEIKEDPHAAIVVKPYTVDTLLHTADRIQDDVNTMT